MGLRLWVGIAAIAAIPSAGALPVAAQNSRWGANYFPNVTLTTQDGVSVHFYDDLVKGKIVAINLIYTTCKFSCPLETARLAQVQTLLGDRMGRDVFFYSITIDPEHDTPPVLKAYAEKFHAGPGWLFLTGTRADIDLISQKIGLYSPPNPSDADGHVPSLLVGNEVTGQWMRNSSIDNPKFLARTIGDWLNSWQGPKRELKSYADAKPMNLDFGEYTFKQHCAACHTIGQGAHIGPDLLGVTKTRDRDWLARFILAPDKLLADDDPIAKELFEKYKNVPMPNLALSPADVSAVVNYLAKQDAAAPASTPSSAVPPVALSPPTPALIDSYLQIQQSLSSDRLTGVKAAARRIVAEADKVGTKAATIRSAAAPLEQAADLRTARAGFASLSDALISYVKESNASLGDEVRVAYCPMLQKYWLQKGTAIRNPYYGTRMLECGRISDLPDSSR
jgi:protein SCO1/2